MALPPGPREPAIFQTASWVRRPLPFLDQQAARFGDCFTIRLVATPPIVAVADPLAIKQIFTGSGAVLHAGAAGARVLTPLVGEHSVLVLDGPEHMRQRRLMLPSFHGARMKAYAGEMRDVAATAIAALPDGELTVHRLMQQITLDVILRTVFGVEDAERVEQLGAQLARVIDQGSRPSLLSVIFRQEFVGRRRQIMRERDRADAMIYDEIERRRRAGDAAQRSDVLSLLLGARDEDGQPMTDTELRDQLVTLLAAGHETSATSLAWTVERVLSHRRVYDRLRDEIDTQLGDEPVTDESASRLEYLDATIKESLRLRPILPMVVRKLAVPMQVCGFDLPAGCIAAPNIYLAHRRAASYPEPELFRPERFVGSKPDPYSWLPFGGGIRRCLGMAFALYEMKIVLATLLQRTDLTLAARSGSRMARRSITLAPSDGVVVQVTGRRSRRKVAQGTRLG